MNNNIIVSKVSYAERLSEINDILQYENEDMTLILQKDQKFITYIKWLKDNGAIFEDNIIYPVAFGPSGLVGVKAKRTINNNEAIVFIPRKLMIVSSDYEKNYIIEEYEEEDKSSIIVTLFLIEEKFKGDKSFYKPYIDLFPEQDFCVFWSDNALNELDCPHLINTIKTLREDFKEDYALLSKEFKEKYSLETFTMFYCHVLSRQFFINEITSALIPLADALNHSAVKIKYEVFDSENHVCKYTGHFSSNKYITPTSCKMYYDYYSKGLIKPNSEENILLCNTNSILIPIEEKDYFVISTNKQTYNEGSQVFNNYGSWPNKSFLKYYCFALLDNKYDYTFISLSFQKGDKLFDTNMETVFQKQFIEADDGINNILKVKVKRKEVCKILLKYFRFIYFYDKKDMSDFNNYTYDYIIEYCILTKSIEMLTKIFNELDQKHSIDDDLQFLETEIIKPLDNDMNRLINSVIFRLTQKVNLGYQIDLLNSILQLLQKQKPNSYVALIEFITEIETISRFDTNANSIGKILTFLISPI